MGELAERAPNMIHMPGLVGMKKKWAGRKGTKYDMPRLVGMVWLSWQKGRQI
jgi:hypothetical protein